MSLTVNLRPKIHRKIWEPVFTPLPVATNACADTVIGRLIASDPGP